MYTYLIKIYFMLSRIKLAILLAWKFQQPAGRFSPQEPRSKVFRTKYISFYKHVKRYSKHKFTKFTD